MSLFPLHHLSSSDNTKYSSIIKWGNSDIDRITNLGQNNDIMVQQQMCTPEYHCFFFDWKQ